MDEPPKHTKRKKSDTKPRIALYDLSRIETFIEIKQIGGCQGCRGGSMGRNCLMQKGFTLG